MGMFDYLVCEHPLPDGRVIEGAVWQTKDGPCDMGVVRITTDGRIEFQVCRWDEVPNKERPYFGKPEWKRGGLFQLHGSIKRVVERTSGADFTGTVNFYRSVPLSEKEWEEYIAVFVDGHLVAIRESSSPA